MSKALTLFLSVIVVFIFLGLMPIHGEADIYDNVVRLHVIANSDSEEDQSLKMKVRDELLEVVSDFVGECKNIDEATAVIEKNIEKIRQSALECIDKEGYEYNVDVILGKEEYPTKNYEGFCFPSGEYLSLRVIIGEGKGQNWWCVLFPPLCMSAASEEKRISAEEALINVGFTSEQYKIITDSEDATYVVRFKILEAAQKVFS